MAASNLPVTDASVASRHIRGEKYGTAGDTKDIVAQVVAAAEHVRVFDGVQSLTLSSTSQTLTVPSNATHCLIYNEATAPATDFARYWQDGTAPTSSVGKKLKDHEEIACASPSTFKAINGVGGNVLRVEFYHYA
jgi:hypothetical protein